MLLHSIRGRALAALAAGAALAANAAATGSTLTFSSSIPVTNTNWSLSVSLPKFDPAQGVLNSVTLTLDGHIEGQAAVESTDASQTTITTQFRADITLARPDNSVIAIVIPQVDNMVTLASFDGTIDFAGPSGMTFANLMQNASQSVTSPPPISDLALYTGVGNIVLPVTAVGTSIATGSGNVITQFTTKASAVVTIVYQFTPPITDCNGNLIDDALDILNGTSLDCNLNGVPDECEPDCDRDGIPDACEPDCDNDGIPDDCDDPCPECVEAGYRIPGSLLLYPIFDNRDGNITLVTVTNTNCDSAPLPGGGALQNGTVDVEFVYIGRLSSTGQVLPCLEFNRTRRLTPCDTITMWTNADNPNQDLGYLYVFAKSPITGRAIVWNHLIGEEAILGGGGALDDSVAAVTFLGIGTQGSDTDDDNDGIRDLDNVEYSQAPDMIKIPRFLGQDPAGPNSVFRSDLILVGLVGSQFDTTLNFLIYNDNEEEFSAQYQFRCWANPLLVEISGIFLESFLDSTTNAGNEIVGQTNKEAGWFQIDGLTATTTAAEVLDPAFYAVLVERTAGYAAAALPFEMCTQANGGLLSHSIFGNQ